MFRKGQIIEYKVGRGWGLGRVESVERGTGRVTIITEGGAEIVRDAASVRKVTRLEIVTEGRK